MHRSGKGKNLAAVLRYHSKMWYNFAVPHFAVPKFAAPNPPPPRHEACACAHTHTRTHAGGVSYEGLSGVQGHCVHDACHAALTSQTETGTVLLPPK